MGVFRKGLSSITGEKKITREQEMEMEPKVMSCSRLAMDVTSASGEKLGKVEEIMLDYETGRISYVILSFDSASGLGEDLFPMPWEALTMSTAKERLILNISKERIRNAPNIARSEWRGEPDRGWITGIFNYYGFAPYWARRK